MILIVWWTANYNKTYPYFHKCCIIIALIYVSLLIFCLMLWNLLFAFLLIYSDKHFFLFLHSIKWKWARDFLLQLFVHVSSSLFPPLHIIELIYHQVKSAQSIFIHLLNMLLIMNPYFYRKFYEDPHVYNFLYKKLHIPNIFLRIDVMVCHKNFTYHHE